MIRAIAVSLLLLHCLAWPDQAAAVPLQLQLNPHTPPNVTGQALSLSVVDQRPRTIPGLTVDGQAIELAEQPTAVLAEALEHALRDAGYRILNTANAGTPHLQISLDELSYRAHKHFLHTTIEAVAVLRARVKLGETTLSKSFQAKSEREVALSPNGAENAAILSSVLTHALEALLGDREIRAALASHP